MSAAMRMRRRVSFNDSSHFSFVGGSAFHKPIMLGTKRPRSRISLPRSLRFPPSASNFSSSLSQGSMASYPAEAAIFTFSLREAGRMVAVSRQMGQGLPPFWYLFFLLVVSSGVAGTAVAFRTPTVPAASPARAPSEIRSEEQLSELQSLMRHSYSV